MTMRKYLVTVHADGSVTAQEFEEPADQTLTTYRDGFQDAVHEILDSLESLKLSFINKVQEYIQCGKMEDASDENGKALAMYIAINLLRRRYGVFFRHPR